MAVTPERWRRIEEVFARALDVAEPERAAFLAEACGDDTELRAEIESLLACDVGASDSLQHTIAKAAVALGGAPVGARIGPYRVRSVIGEGGMGTVYLAERDDDEYHRTVAIKVLRHGLASPHLVARFRDERQLLAGLDHPGIVRLLDGGRTEEGLPYLVMEYVDGTPFATHARRHGVRARVELVIRVAAALQYAHQKLVVHRDVKPSNILVDRTGSPKLLDFGIAKLLDPGAAGREAETRTGMAAFTVEYASPEQVRGEAVSVATDVYSLGAVLYDLLCGRPPQRAGATPLETLENVCERDPPRASVVAPPELRRELSGDLDNILMKALQKQSERRYASVAQLADDLGRYLAGVPVIARPATFAYRAGKFAARHRGAVALATLVTAALGAATVVSIRQARRADRQAARAERERNTLLVERGRQELDAGHAGRALPYLVEALRGGDNPALRFLLAEAMRPFEQSIASMSSDEGFIGAEWSPDGTRVAVMSTSSGGQIYSADGEPLVRFAFDAPQLRAPHYSPDGSLLTAVTGDGRVVLWDASTGETLRVITDHAVAPPVPIVTCAVFTPDGERLVTGGADGHVAVWDIATGERLARLAAGSTVSSAAVSADGAIIAAGVDDGSIALWDAATGAPLGRLVGHRGYVDPLVFARDGRLYSAGDDQTVRIWDVSARAAVSTFRGRTFDLDPDGARIVTGGTDDVARIWNARDGALVVELGGHDAGGIRAVRFSGDGTRVVTTGGDGTFRIWDAASGRALTALESVPGAGRARLSMPGPLDARFSPDGTRLVTVAGAATTLWRVDGAPLIDEIITGGHLWSASYSPDERLVAASGYGVLTIWESGRSVARIEVDGQRLYDAGWSPDGGRLVLVGEPDIARVYEMDGTLVFPLVGHRGAINRGSFSPDGTRILTASVDHTARIWDAATGTELRALAHPDSVMAAAWSRDGSRIATAGWDHRLRVWDAATGDELTELDGGDVQYLDVTFRPDGRALTASGKGGEVETWDLATGMRRRFEGHTGTATIAVWSPDGALIATSATDGTARVWDPASGTVLATRRHPAEVMSVQWSRDGNRILTGCYDGSARTWDVRRDSHTVDELDELVARHTPYRLVAGRLEHGF